MSTHTPDAWATESVQDAQEPRVLFEVLVTRSIGSVVSGGRESPRVAAFRMIAMEETDGDFSFPDQDESSTVHVKVDTEKHAPPETSYPPMKRPKVS